MIDKLESYVMSEVDYENFKMLASELETIRKKYNFYEIKTESHSQDDQLLIMIRPTLKNQHKRFCYSDLTSNYKNSYEDFCNPKER